MLYFLSDNFIKIFETTTKTETFAIFNLSYEN